MNIFNKIFAKLCRNKNIIPRQIIKYKTETNKYLDPECNLYRYSKFDYYSDKLDDLYKYHEGIHTIPVPEEVSFEEASSISNSFKTDKDSYEKKLLKHQLFKNPQKGTIISTNKYIYEDGSLFTTMYSYKDNYG